MSYVADLADMGGGTLAVGWLHPDHSFTQGELSPAFLARFKEFLERWSVDSVNALGWGGVGGYHTCELCNHAWGTGSIGVLYEGKLYCAPRMIEHYLMDHGYSPPAEFIEAVLSGPLPGTPEYVSAAASFRKRASASGDE
jgi:hypothetical protein